jgi:hypothetical protein
MRQLPFRLIEDGTKSFLAAQLENVAKLRVHFVALSIGQVEPGDEQLGRLGFLHSIEVQIAKLLPRSEIAGEHRIRYLPKEESR